MSTLKFPSTKRRVKVIRARTDGDDTGNTVPGRTDDLVQTSKTLTFDGKKSVGSPLPARTNPSEPAVALPSTANTTHHGEGDILLTTVAKTVALLAKPASPTTSGQYGEEGNLLRTYGKGKDGSTGVTYGSKQSRRSASAAKRVVVDISPEATVPNLERDSVTSMPAPEPCLYSSRAFHFVAENRTEKFTKGSTITYGSIITVKAFHGGILCFNQTGEAQASAFSVQPNALLTVWNLRDLGNKGPVRYGDHLFLQMGRHEVMGSSLLMKKETITQRESSRPTRLRTSISYVSGGDEGDQDTDNVTRKRNSTHRARGSISSPSVSAAESGNASKTGGTIAGKLKAIPFRGNNIDKAKHTGRWVILGKENPERTVGAEVCHLDRVVLQQGWLCLASDRPGDACLKNIGSIDDFCYQQQLQSTSTRGEGDFDSVREGKDGGVCECIDDVVKRAFSIRSEFVWTVVGVQYSAITAKRKASAASGRSSARKLEAAALRQLQSSKSTRLVAATKSIREMRQSGDLVVLKAPEALEEGQEKRLQSLSKKFLRVFRRKRSRDWRPNHGQDQYLNIGYGPASSWKKIQEQRENQMCTMHTASTERAHSPNSVSFATSPTTAAVDHSNMMPGSCIENNVRAHCPYKMQLAEIFGHFIGPRAGTTVIGGYKYGARPKTPSGRSCGLHGRRPWNSSRKLDSMTGGRWAVTAGGEDEKKERQREQRKLTSTDRPSKIAWTGPCGVRGVVTRMKGYEKSGFRTFGGDNKAGTVDRQMARDNILLDDLQQTLRAIVTWARVSPVANKDQGDHDSLASTSADSSSRFMDDLTNAVDESPGGRDQGPSPQVRQQLWPAPSVPLDDASTTSGRILESAPQEEMERSSSF